MCIVIDTTAATSAPPTPGCPAKALDPSRRQDLAVAALAGLRPVSVLAAEHHVSRKFVYQQAGHADGALRLAFGPDPGDAAEDPVLF
ncbi:MAG: hypothetical protein ACRC33_24165, partial [Gemmataceae bacterium]